LSQFYASTQKVDSVGNYASSVESCGKSIQGDNGFRIPSGTIWHVDHLFSNGRREVEDYLRIANLVARRELLIVKMPIMKCNISQPK
jgi:hypothetical protein